MINIQNNSQTFTIYENGVDVTEDYIPSKRVRVAEIVRNQLNRTKDNLKLETRMIIFDGLHRTHYRRIRRSLMAEKKRRLFEEEIGLVLAR
ncbi:MAG: hypothetical protein ACREHG_09005 [Candidatus Saccharimonadales bacterium]